MPYPLKPFVWLGSGLGATLLGSAWLAGLPARADLAPTPTTRQGSLGTTVNGLQTPCGSGLCQVQGGTSRGNNLFHRFDRFDTRPPAGSPGITGVNFLNGNQGAVIVGVTSASGSFITAPVTGLNGAALFFLSPGGINISGKGGFTGWGDLLLTTKTNLAFGSSLFNAFTTVPDSNPNWSLIPVLASSSLSNDPASLTNNGLVVNGAISLEGTLISVDRNLLIDSGNGGLSLLNTTIGAGLTGTPFGETTNGGAGFQGKTITVTGSSITALKNVFQAEKVELSSSQVVAPRGFIRILGTDEIRISDSQLLVAPQKPEDLYSPGLGFQFLVGDTTVNRVVPGEINLQTTNPLGAGISLTKNSLLDASTDLRGPAFANIDRNEIKFDLLAGTIALNSANGLSIDSTNIYSNSSDNYAGQIALFSKGAAGLEINSSQLNANSPNGSGDIDIDSKGTTTINKSFLSADSTGIVLDQFGSPSGLSPAGQVRINSEGKISLSDTTISTKYELIDQASRTVNNTSDGLDEDFVDQPLPLIRLRSADGINLLDSTLDASSTAGFAGSIELLAGTGDPIQISGSNIKATAGDGTANPFGFGTGGLINLFSGAGISIGANPLGTPSVLDVSSAFAPVAGQINLLNDSTNNPLSLGPGTEFTATTAPAGTGSSMLISSQGGLNLDDVSLDASGGSGGQITLAGKGGLSIASSQFTSTGSDPEGTSPATQVISLDGSTIFQSNNTFTPVPPTIISALSLDPEVDQPLFDTAAQTIQNKTGTLSDTLAKGSEVFLEDGPISRSSWLAARLDQGRAPDFDLIIDNRDPNNIVLTRVDQSRTISSLPTTTSQQFDLSNAADAAALRSLLGDNLFDEVVNQTPIEATNLNTPSEAQQSSTEQSITTSAQLANNGQEQGSEKAPATTGVATETLAVKSTEKLDSQQALESFGEGELTSLQAVIKALGLAGNLSNPPSLPQMQSYMQRAMEAIRAKKSSLTGNLNGSQAPAIASLSTDNLLLSKASFDSANYKPAILRYSFTPMRAEAGGTAEAAKAPATGLIDIVLVLPEGAPQGWRVEVPIAKLRESLAQHYANMAGMGPLPSGNPAASPAASQLAQLLVEPVQGTLKANGVTSLIISSDLNLIDVPYASLPVAGGYVGERYAVTITPSLALTSLTSNEKRPVYGKESLIRAGATQFSNGLAPLPMVEQELTTIAREDGGTVLLNQAFSSSSLLKALSDPAVKRIHIASHAELKPGKEADARIYTSSSSVGLKELGQVRQRQAGQGLDLVSLSACRSAVSGSDLELGFAGMAIQLGAKSAIGTKWYVDDLATSSFFVQFYSYLDQGIPKAEAIQMTQKAFLSGEVHLEGDKVVGSGGSTLIAGLSPAQQRRYASGFRHPYFWAAAQLVGSPW